MRSARPVEPNTDSEEEQDLSFLVDNDLLRTLLGSRSIVSALVEEEDEELEAVLPDDDVAAEEEYDEPFDMALDVGSSGEESVPEHHDSDGFEVHLAHTL